LNDHDAANVASALLFSQSSSPQLPNSPTPRPSSPLLPAPRSPTTLSPSQAVLKSFDFTISWVQTLTGEMDTWVDTLARQEAQRILQACGLLVVMRVLDDRTREQRLLDDAGGGDASVGGDAAAAALGAAGTGAVAAAGALAGAAAGGDAAAGLPPLSTVGGLEAASLVPCARQFYTCLGDIVVSSAFDRVTLPRLRVQASNQVVRLLATAHDALYAAVTDAKNGYTAADIKGFHTAEQVRSMLDLE
jgi:hypothetical protein